MPPSPTYHIFKGRARPNWRIQEGDEVLETSEPEIWTPLSKGVIGKVFISTVTYRRKKGQRGRPHGTKRSDKVKVTVHISEGTSAYLKAEAERRSKFMGDVIDDAVAVARKVRAGFGIK